MFKGVTIFAVAVITMTVALSGCYKAEVDDYAIRRDGTHRVIATCALVTVDRVYAEEVLTNKGGTVPFWCARDLGRVGERGTMTTARSSPASGASEVNHDP